MKRLLIATSIAIVSLNSMAVTTTPYKGQQNREIKALSQEQIDGYLSGKGMGYAKAAELNQYPGPKHVLDLVQELNLSTQQVQQTQAIFDRMKTRAVDLGKQLIDKERQLEQAFAGGTINNQILDSLVTEIGALQAKIRTTHLAAHLEQKALLSKHQIHEYNRLRGYGSGAGHQHQGTH